MDNEIEKKRIKRKHKIGIALFIIGCILVGYGLIGGVFFGIRVGGF